MKSLKNILATAKVFRIILLILFILSIIGESFILIGMLTYGSIATGIVIDGKTVADMLAEKGITMSLAYLSMSIALIAGALAIFTAKYLELYCKRILATGTPFTREMVKDTRLVARVVIIVAASVFVVCMIVNAIFKGVYGDQITQTPGYPGWSEIFVGLALYILSFFMEYPVEVEEQRKEQREGQINPEDYQE